MVPGRLKIQKLGGKWEKAVGAKKVWIFAFYQSLSQPVIVEVRSRLRVFERSVIISY